MNLLLIHGALGSATQFDKLARALNGAHTIHVVELEGHGSTPATEPQFSIETFVSNVRALITARSIGQTAIFGHSMGGYVALKLAVESPELVSSVITLGTKIDWTPEIALLETSRLDASKIRAKVPAFAVHMSKRHRGVPGGWELVLARTTALMTELGDRPLIDSTFLSQIRQPVRMMVGDRDAFVSVEETAAAVKSIPNGELAVLPNSPHPLEQTRVSLISSMIQDFLIESESGPST